MPSTALRLACAALLLGACGRPSSAPATPAPSAEPNLEESAAAAGFESLEAGILWREDHVAHDAGETTVWSYRPEHVDGRLPLVLIAPAGSILITGMDLGDGDRPEHLPYVREGMLVVSYSLTGAMGPDASDAEFDAATYAFLEKSFGGLVDMRAALDHALATLPVDPERVFIAGHSSAATHALLAAEAEPRIRAVAAYAPVVDLVAHFRRQGVDDAAFDEAVLAFSPHAHAGRLRQPSLLFIAEDDDGISLEEMRAFHSSLPANPRREFVVVPSGGHYLAMIREGVPAGIRFFQGLPPAEATTP